MIAVKFPGFGPPETRRLQAETKYLGLTRSGGQKLLVPELTGLGSQAQSGLLYFVLPDSHAGNLLKSYGARLRFNINFSSNSGEQLEAPLVMIVASISDCSVEPVWSDNVCSAGK